MYVYIIRSSFSKDKYYLGCTSNLRKRLAEHNHSKVNHTKKYIPWKLSVALWFEEESKAWKFEKYLKTGSGWAFRKNHF